MGGNCFSMPHDKVRQLVAKYENMLQTEKSEYFDIDELDKDGFEGLNDLSMDNPYDDDRY